MKRNIVRVVGASAIVAAAISLHAAPAAASGTIFAVVTLTNATRQCIPIPFSGAQTGSAWGTQGYTMDYSPTYIVMADGTPARFLAPGQTMLWGTKSNGGTGATSGTGGSLTIPLASQNATMSWSVPWSYFNGLGGDASSSQGAPQTGSFPSPTPFTMAGGGLGCSGDGDNTCEFAFTLGGGPAPTPGAPPNTLGSGMCLSMPTGSTSGQSATGTTLITSTDGSTTLSIIPNTFGTPSQSGGVLMLSGPNGTWQAPSNTVIAAQITETGNFVAWDSYGDIVWQSGTSDPGAILAVGPTSLAVSHAEKICFPFMGREYCEYVNHDDWTAPIAPTQVAQ